MQREKLMAAGINYEAGLRRFVGKEDLYEKYLEKFLSDAYFTHFMDAMQMEDYDAAFKMAHALKGMTGTLGMEALFEAMSPLVEALRSKDIAAAKEKIAAAEQEYNRITAALQ